MVTLCRKSLRKKRISSYDVFLGSLFVAALLLPTLLLVEAKDETWKPRRKDESDSHLFEVSSRIRVNGPSMFPSPTRQLHRDYNQTISVVIQPSYGLHRPDADAILAYAEGYAVASYMMFIETLKESNYTGDVVLAIAHDSYIQAGVKDYLLQYTKEDPDENDQELSGPNVVLYQLDLDCDGSPDGKRTVLGRSKSTDVFQMCRLDDVYGYYDDVSKTMIPLKDTRGGRAAATLRYEWYWIWSLQYNSHSWLMLVDARDTFFQSNPFADLPRTTGGGDQGLLYFFGENANATSLGRSRHNANWLRNGYGEATILGVSDKPVICSGSSMGEQVAIETYLRALINEHDECSVRMTGSDQGFHNYLYYSGKLLNADAISRLVVWEQGRGIINNLGAMRIDTLTNWGIRDPVTSAVYQWDGTTLSPVLHQWDRDKELSVYMNRRQLAWNRQWEAQRKEKRAESTDTA